MYLLLQCQSCRVTVPFTSNDLTLPAGLVGAIRKGIEVYVQFAKWCANCAAVLEPNPRLTRIIPISRWELYARRVGSFFLRLRRPRVHQHLAAGPEKSRHASEEAI